MANRREDEFTPAQQGNRDRSKGNPGRDDDMVRGGGEDMIEEGEDDFAEDDELDEEDEEGDGSL